MSEPYDGAMPTDKPNIWENANGFWFTDESYDWNGPYSTKADAEVVLKAYFEWLNRPKAINGTGNLPQCDVKYYGG